MDVKNTKTSNLVLMSDDIYNQILEKCIEQNCQEMLNGLLKIEREI